MSSLSDTVKAVLSGDATFAGYATGGIHAEPEISRQATPTAFNANGELLPCCLVVLSEVQQNDSHRKAVRQFVDLFFYQRWLGGTDSIDNMANRAYRLLHDTRIAGTARIYFDSELPDVAESVLSANVRRAAYVADSIR